MTMTSEEEQLKEISVAEFFEKNRHLLGFSNPQKAVISCVKEAVDNSLDAAESADILPEIHVNVEDLDKGKVRLQIKDNAIGLSKQEIPKVFGKLLYGSKFHRLLQSRGQQGVGISAAGLYAQLTSGEPAEVISKKDGETHRFRVKIDTKKNEPEIIENQKIDSYEFDHGTSISLDIEGKYVQGTHSVRNYLKKTAIMNPFAHIKLEEPDGNVIEFPRVVDELPKKPKEIKPHPNGIELGILMRMLKETNARVLSSFLKSEFSRVGGNSADKIIETAELSSKQRPKSLDKEDAEKLLKGMRETKLQSPPTNCLSPIGEDLLKEGMRKELNPEFLVSVTRSPDVYRGMPFQIECAIAYGGDIDSSGRYRPLRYANKVPLLYKKSACATTEAIRETDWSRYGVSQSGGRPQGPLYILLHMASVWVPYTSEGKEAIANYPGIVKEMKLALQEAGRKLKRYISKKKKREIQEKKKKKLTSYIKEIAPALTQLADMDKSQEELDKKLEEIVMEDYNPEGV